MLEAVDAAMLRRDLEFVYQACGTRRREAVEMSYGLGKAFHGVGDIQQLLPGCRAAWAGGVAAASLLPQHDYSVADQPGTEAAMRHHFFCLRESASQLCRTAPPPAALSEGCNGNMKDATPMLTA